MSGIHLELCKHSELVAYNERHPELANHTSSLDIMVHLSYLNLLCNVGSFAC